MTLSFLSRGDGADANARPGARGSARACTMLIAAGVLAAAALASGLSAGVFEASAASAAGPDDEPLRIQRMEYPPPDAGGVPVEDELIRILDRGVFHWVEEKPELQDGDDYVIRFSGQSVDASLMLPPHPVNPAMMRRILLEVLVEPITLEGQPLTTGKPADPWPRLGSVLLVRADSEEERGAAAAPGAGVDAGALQRRWPAEVELMRFVTGFGTRGTFVQDVTALAPLLTGPVTFRTTISSFSQEPGWRTSVRLRMTTEGLGAERPRFTAPLLTDFHITAEQSSRSAEVIVPAGMQTPRLRVLSTGHATDGQAGNEFMSCTHVLRINGTEVARWRPWREGDGTLRPQNLWAGRRATSGRTVWSSDLGRSGWLPGSLVEPLWIPLPELTPGRHRIELAIEGIRPADPPNEEGQKHHGYWAVSAILVADELWSER